MKLLLISKGFRNRIYPECVGRSLRRKVQMPLEEVNINTKYFWTRKGVTLVEVLIVMAILAVLVLFLYPQFNGAREKAHAARCLGNLRNMGKAILEYAGDNNGILYPRKYTWPDPDTGELKSQYFYKMMVSRGYFDAPLPNGNVGNPMLFCPSILPPGKSVPDEWSQTYGMRAWDGTAVARDDLLPINRISDPSRFFLLADSIKPPGTGGSEYETQWYTIQLGDGQSNYVDARHAGKANTFFLDGHVESTDKEYFEELGDHDPEFSRKGFVVYPR